MMAAPGRPAASSTGPGRPQGRISLPPHGANDPSQGQIPEPGSPPRMAVSLGTPATVPDNARGRVYGRQSGPPARKQSTSTKVKRRARAPGTRGAQRHSLRVPLSPSPRWAMSKAGFVGENEAFVGGTPALSPLGQFQRAPNTKGALHDRVPNRTGARGIPGHQAAGPGAGGGVGDKAEMQARGAGG